MTRDEILNAIKKTHAEFLVAIADVPDDVSVRARIIDWWSLKDIAAHLTFWYTVATQFVREYQTHGAPQPMDLDDAKIDALNHRAVVVCRDYALARVRAELDAAYRELLAAVEVLSDADVNKMLPAPWNPNQSVTLEKLIAVNAHEHLPEHIAQIQKWKSTPRA